MAKITITDFGPMMPRINATQLPNNMATIASGCDFRAKDLRGKNAPSWIETYASLEYKSLWKAGALWVKSLAEIQIVASQIQESNDRFFYTGDGFPKQSDSSLWPTYRRLGVLPPLTAPVINLTGTPDAGTQAVVSYVYTFVTDYGEESAPSPFTTPMTVPVGQGINLTGLVTRTGTDNVIATKRIYRLSAGSTGSEYLYLGEIDEAETTFSDYQSGSLKECSTEVLPTEYWDAPPDDLEGLTQAHNGMMIGYRGKEVYVSDTYVPYAYPTKWVMTLDSDVTGIGATDEFIFASSERFPYIISGTSPDALFPKKISISEPCLSHRGIVSTGTTILYPSPSGLSECDGNTVRVLTEDWMRPEDWNALAPSTLHAFHWQGQYYAFKVGDDDCLIIDLKNGGIQTFYINGSGHHFLDGCINPTDGQIYTLSEASSGGTSTYLYRATSTAYYQAGFTTFQWKSKEFVDKHNYTCAKITSDWLYSGTTVKYYVDGVLVSTQLISSNDFFRLPHVDGRRKQIELQGRSTVTALQIATSPSELI